MIKVAAIIGLEHSGTTLLARMIGAHSKAVATGGLKNFPAFLEGQKTCSCGESCGTCPFWRAVLQDLREQGEQPRLIAAALAAGLDDVQAARQAANILIAGIGRTANASVIVETSRDPKRFPWLQGGPGIKVVPLHIFKAPDAQAASALRKGRSAFREIARYNYRSRHCRRAFEEAGSAIALPHVALCASPDAEIARVMKALGEMPEPQQISEWGEAPVHMIGGNRMLRSRGSALKSGESSAPKPNGFARMAVRAFGRHAYRSNLRSASKGD